MDKIFDVEYKYFKCKIFNYQSLSNYKKVHSDTILDAKNYMCAYDIVLCCLAINMVDIIAEL